MNNTNRYQSFHEFCINRAFFTNVHKTKRPLAVLKLIQKRSAPIFPNIAVQGCLDRIRKRRKGQRLLYAQFQSFDASRDRLYLRNSQLPYCSYKAEGSIEPQAMTFRLPSRRFRHFDPKSHRRNRRLRLTTYKQFRSGERQYQEKVVSIRIRVAESSMIGGSPT